MPTFFKLDTPAAFKARLWLALLLVVVAVLAISLAIHKGVERKLGPRLRRLLSAPKVSAANPA